MYFKNELKYSELSDHVTDDVMSFFRLWKKLSGRTLLSCKFSLPCDETSTLYSPWPSFPTFSLMFIASLNFKCSTQPKPQICHFISTQWRNLVTETKKTLIQQWSRDWWRHYLRCDMWIYFKANVIFLWSGSLLHIKLSKL